MVVIYPEYKSKNEGALWMMEDYVINNHTKKNKKIRSQCGGANQYPKEQITKGTSLPFLPNHSVWC
jgi:hypothetical protein